jgi:hypothetical protein
MAQRAQDENLTPISTVLGVELPYWGPRSATKVWSGFLLDMFHKGAYNEHYHSDPIAANVRCFSNAREKHTQVGAERMGLHYLKDWSFVLQNAIRPPFIEGQTEAAMTAAATRGRYNVHLLNGTESSVSAAQEIEQFIQSLAPERQIRFSQELVPHANHNLGMHPTAHLVAGFAHRKLYLNN